MNTPTPRIHEDMAPFATRSLAEIHDEICRLWAQAADRLQPQCNEVTESPGSNPENGAPITAPAEREGES